MHSFVTNILISYGFCRECQYINIKFKTKNLLLKFNSSIFEKQLSQSYFECLSRSHYIRNPKPRDLNLRRLELRFNLEITRKYEVTRELFFPSHFLWFRRSGAKWKVPRDLCQCSATEKVDLELSGEFPKRVTIGKCMREPQLGRRANNENEIPALWKSGLLTRIEGGIVPFARQPVARLIIWDEVI